MGKPKGRRSSGRLDREPSVVRCIVERSFAGATSGVTLAPGDLPASLASPPASWPGVRSMPERPRFRGLTSSNAGSILAIEGAKN